MAEATRPAMLVVQFLRDDEQPWRALRMSEALRAGGVVPLRVRHEFVEQAALLIGDLREVRIAWASMKQAQTQEHERIHLTIDCDGNTRKVDWLLVRARNSFDPAATIARSGLPAAEIHELPNEDPSSRQVRLWTVQTPAGMSVQYLQALLAAKDALWGERQDNVVAVPAS